MSADDMEVLAAQPLVVTYRGERLELTPVTLGELPAFACAAESVLPALTLLASATDADADTIFSELLRRFGSAMFPLIALGIRREESWVSGGQSVNEFIALFNAVIEVNRDFFIRALRAERQSLAAANGTGPMPSNPSSNAATH